MAEERQNDASQEKNGEVWKWETAWLNWEKKNMEDTAEAGGKDSLGDNGNLQEVFSC